MAAEPPFRAATHQDWGDALRVTLRLWEAVPVDIAEQAGSSDASSEPSVAGFRFTCSKRGVVVASVGSTGSLERHNSSSAHTDRVFPGDRIVEVNGRALPENMADELKRGSAWILLVERAPLLLAELSRLPGTPLGLSLDVAELCGVPVLQVLGVQGHGACLDHNLANQGRPFKVGQFILEVNNMRTDLGKMREALDTAGDLRIVARDGDFLRAHVECGRAFRVELRRQAAAAPDAGAGVGLMQGGASDENCAAGFRLLHSDGGLVVGACSARGPLEEHNQSHDFSIRVYAGDRILRVNGREGVAVMAEELGQGDVWALKVERPPTQQIRIVRSEGEDLGLQLATRQETNELPWLEVVQVAQEGPVARHNAGSSLRRLRVGQRVLEVNELRTDLGAMLEACRSSLDVTLVVRDVAGATGAVTPPASAAESEPAPAAALAAERGDEAAASMGARVSFAAEEDTAAPAAAQLLMSEEDLPPVKLRFPGLDPRTSADAFEEAFRDKVCIMGMSWVSSRSIQIVFSHGSNVVDVRSDIDALEELLRLVSDGLEVLDCIAEVVDDNDSEASAVEADEAEQDAPRGSPRDSGRSDDAVPIEMGPFASTSSDMAARPSRQSVRSETSSRRRSMDMVLTDQREQAVKEAYNFIGEAARLLERMAPDPSKSTAEPRRLSEAAGSMVGQDTTATRTSVGAQSLRPKAALGGSAGKAVSPKDVPGPVMREVEDTRQCNTKSCEVDCVVQ